MPWPPLLPAGGAKATDPDLPLSPLGQQPARGGPACLSSCRAPLQAGPRPVEGLQLGSLSELNLGSARSRGLGGKWLSQGERRRGRGRPKPANLRHPRAFLELRPRLAREPDVPAPHSWAAGSIEAAAP